MPVNITGMFGFLTHFVRTDLSIMLLIDHIKAARIENNIHDI
jgi:hypothetical protein